MRARPSSAARSVAVAVAVGLVTAVLLWAQPLGASASSLQLAPVADAYVSSDTPSTNYGSATILRIDGSPTVISYLRFDLPSVGGTVTKATLDVFANSASGVGYDVYLTGGTGWSESSLTYASAPGLTTVVGTAAPFTAATWTAVDVTSVVATGNVIDVALVAKNTTAVSLASRESATPPVLVVTVASSTPAPTATTATQTTTPGASPTGKKGGPKHTPGATLAASPTARSTITPLPTSAATPTETLAPTPTRAPTPAPTRTPAPTGSTSADPVVLAAGDVRSNLSGIQATTKVILGLPGDPLLNVGDDTVDGSAALYQSYFDPNWGQFKNRIWPTPGNHEYDSSGAAPYFAYYGARAGSASKSWYSFDLANNWHVIELNGNVAHGAGSAQEVWLKSDLAANAGKHIIAFWHQPRFSSGLEHGSDTSFTPFWNDLYAAHADIVLNGHDHDYERFALQNSSGQADAKGIREWVVGMGGAPLYAFGTIQPNSQVRQSSTYGVLELTLGAHSYSWRFVPQAGRTFTDSGTTATHS